MTTKEEWLEIQERYKKGEVLTRTDLQKISDYFSTIKHVEFGS